MSARIAYTIDTGEPLVNETFGPGNIDRRHTGRLEQREVRIGNARERADLSLDTSGFVLLPHATGVTDFFDPAQLEAVYYPEIVALVRQAAGARRVVVFDHTLRSGDESERREKRLREVIRGAHNDYTAWSGPQRVRDVLPAEAEALLARRFAIIQVWRPIQPVIEANPLAFADAGSVAPADLLVAERRYPDRVGQTYRLAFNPAHRWWYFPRQRRDEAIVFKVYDSLQDGRARFTPHTSFDDPATPADAAPRRSIEVRTLAFF
ncbi:MAG: methyltransferase [Burkholderiales bacterium]|nr:methyltransferase [Burkholderiales bacterium]